MVVSKDVLLQDNICEHTHYRYTDCQAFEFGRLSLECIVRYQCDKVLNLEEKESRFHEFVILADEETVQCSNYLD